MPFTNWKSVKKGALLPNDKVASQFQYKHFINWEVDLLTVFGIGVSQGKGDWHIRLIGPTGIPLFEQKVEVTIFLVSLGDLGQYIFTWEFKKEVINTLVVGGVEISVDNPAWKYTLGNSKLSEFGNLIPGGGADYGTSSVVIMATWHSPVYKMRLPPGCTLEVVKDSWGLGVSSRPEYQFRFLYGVSRLIEAKFGHSNELITAAGFRHDEVLMTGHSWPSYDNGRSRGMYIPNAWSPTLIVYPNGREILGVEENDGFWEYESYDGQRQWKRVKYNTEVPGEKKEMPLFQPNSLMPQSLLTPNGRYVIAVRGGDIVLKHVKDESQSKLVRVGKAVGDQSYAIDINSSGLMCVVDESAKPVFQSPDGGMTWQTPQNTS